MGKGLKFLMVKPWHPLTKRNQEKKFLAESKESDRLKYETERADDLRREADFMSNKKMAGDNTVDAVKLRMQAPVSFMYQEPPGLLAMRQREAKEAAERELNGPRPALSDNPSEREKLVAKFPFLANAPQEGKYTEQMAIHLKPFGMETRMVRCLRCGLWGHGAGEKICPQANDLPPTDRVTKTLLDPMRVSAMADSLANPTEEVYSYDGKGAKLAFRQAPMPMGASAQIGKSRKGSHDGQHSAEALLQQLDELQEVDEQDLANPSAVDDRERAFLASLTEEEKRLVMEHLQLERQQSSETKHKKRKAKKEKKEKRLDRQRHRHDDDAERSKKKHKHKKRKHRHSSSSDSSDSSDDESKPDIKTDQSNAV